MEYWNMGIPDIIVPLFQYSIAAIVLYSVKPKNFTALSSMIFLRISGFMLTCWNSSSQRSTPMAGQSEPNNALSWSRVFTL